MRLAVFGATGGTGRAAIAQALEAGDKVTALARDPGALAEFGDRITVVGGDVLDPDAVGRVVAGSEAVVSALGIGMHRHATTVYSQGTGNILDAMRAEGTRRLLVVSTSSLEIPPPKHVAEWFLARFLLHRILAKPYADMAEMERRVRASDVDWTLVRAARLTNGPVTGRYRTARNGKLRGCWSISRADVAHHLLAHVGDASTFRSTVEIAY
ncbi:NAD(P)-dependent oxidoreductase [Actinophytocola gossypii]|uniref:SDR family oxidoreductase n=1 Tax=Actinophytocola gossypii TaxID=2812003 RepID=A0ABT2JDM1_9PSEU|nr:SDR family oxidoreductase [Actinophytocola gossypii]MCT2585843.1 SDR family oxidoreductase [Actinophytocola gossypii]